MRRPPQAVLIPLEAGALGMAVGLVAVAPWIAGTARGEFLLLTDWVSGPNSTVSAGLYGLADDSLDALPWRLGVQTLRAWLGPGHTAWLLILLAFPIAAAGAAHLVRGGRAGGYAAALVVTCSPLVTARVAVGHVAFLMGVALLPWLVASARHARSQQRVFSGRTAGWFALAVSISPHLAWIGGAALLIVTVVPWPSRRDLLRLVLVLGAAAAVYSYALVVMLAQLPTITVDDDDLTAFATRSDTTGGIWLSALTLRGFWRDGSDHVATTLGAFALPVALAFLVVAGYGLAVLLRAGTTRGPLAVAFIAAGTILTLGADGPFGAWYRAAFEHLPLMHAMREPQKWSALTQLGLALAAAAAAQALRGRGRAWPPRLAAAGVVALPLTLLPALAWGVGASITTSRYPQGWYDTERVLADVPTLMLPWHGYQPFAFTDGRSVATPGGAFFSPPMLVSTAVELGPLRTNSTSVRQRAVDELVAAGGSATFGADLAALGIQQIVIATDPGEAGDVAWVDRQPGVARLLATDTMTAYRVLPRPAGADRVTAAGPTRFDIAPGAPGPVVLPVECSPGWRLDDRPGTCTAAGTVEFQVAAGPATVVYQPWAWLRWGLLASIAALVALLAVGVREHLTDPRSRP